MASPKTLEHRQWQLLVEEWLKGYYIVKHPLKGKGTPYVKHMHPKHKATEGKPNEVK